MSNSYDWSASVLACLPLNGGASGTLALQSGDGLRSHHFVNRHPFPDKLLVLFRREGLCAVREGLLRLIVNFDNQTIGAACHARACARHHHLVLPGAV